MKCILIIAFFLVFSCANAESLISDTCRIDITPCKEGEVTCDPRVFLVTELATDNKVKYLGQSLSSTCTDGVTPCHHQGYKFKTLNGEYFLYLDGKLEFLNKSG